MFNIALVLQHMSKIVLQSEYSSLESLENSLSNMNMALHYFEYLKEKGDSTRFNIAVAGVEAKHCKDLLSQVEYHLNRARHTYEEVKARRLIQMKKSYKKPLENRNGKIGKVRIARQGYDKKNVKFLSLIARTKQILKEPLSNKKRRYSKYYKSTPNTTMAYKFSSDSDSDKENHSKLISNISEADLEFQPESKPRKKIEAEFAVKHTSEVEPQDYSKPDNNMCTSPGECESIGSDEILQLEESSDSVPMKRVRYSILKESKTSSQ